MSESGAERAGDDEARRVEELLRINSELAEEIRSLRAGRADAPRSLAMPAARRVGRLEEERDSLRAELARSQAELDGLRQHSENLAQHVADQAGQIEALGVEVDRLRSGGAGLLRRVRARLLRR
jgi:FtsZ-binding cell division protein ZapB